MITLSLEQSTPHASLALHKGENLLGHRAWQDTQARNQQFFLTLPGFLQEAGLALQEVDRFVVGLGPGSFSSLRIAVSALRAIALPDGKEVYGLSSGEALALQTVMETGSEKVTVIGDARREQFWIGRFEQRGDGLVQKQEWKLIGQSALPDLAGQDDVIVTPDWDRIGDRLKATSGLNLRDGTRTPDAKYLAQCALSRIRRNIPSESLTPLYMHPPVREPAASQPSNQDSIENRAV